MFKPRNDLVNSIADYIDLRFEAHISTRVHRREQQTDYD